MADLNASVRTTAEAVREIIDTDLTTGQIHAFINSAYFFVTAQLVGKGLSSDQLADIECWLAAHFLATRDQRVERETIGDEYQATYQGKSGMGLQATTYGQMAIALDTSGTLLKQGQGVKTASLRVISEYDE